MAEKKKSPTEIWNDKLETAYRKVMELAEDEPNADYPEEDEEKL